MDRNKAPVESVLHPWVDWENAQDGSIFDGMRQCLELRHAYYVNNNLPENNGRHAGWTAGYAIVDYFEKGGEPNYSVAVVDFLEP